MEGYGAVSVMCSDGLRDFAHAPFKLETAGRTMFVDSQNNLAIVPLWRENGALGVLVATPDQGESAVAAARAIQARIEGNVPTADNESGKILDQAITAFKHNEFEKSRLLAAAGKGEKQ